MNTAIGHSHLLRMLRIFGALALGIYLAGCASFDARWRAAGAAAKTGSATRWDGRWTSAKHHTLGGAPEGGRLRCVLQRTARDHVDACFHANFLCFSANYSVQLQRKPGGLKWEYQGTQELPAIFGGTYRYSALIQRDRVSANYYSTYDNGSFALHGVKGN